MKRLVEVLKVEMVGRDQFHHPIHELTLACGHVKRIRSIPGEKALCEQCLDDGRPSDQRTYSDRKRDEDRYAVAAEHRAAINAMSPKCIGPPRLWR